MINVKGRFAYRTGGTFTGDAVPGSRTTVQRNLHSRPRSRLAVYELAAADPSSCSRPAPQATLVTLDWKLVCHQAVDHLEVEQSTRPASLHGTAFGTGRGTALEQTPDFPLCR